MLKSECGLVVSLVLLHLRIYVAGLDYALPVGIGKP